jgi:hypothetical protein
VSAVELNREHRSQRALAFADFRKWRAALGDIDSPAHGMMYRRTWRTLAADCGVDELVAIFVWPFSSRYQSRLCGQDDAGERAADAGGATDRFEADAFAFDRLKSNEYVK